MTRRFAMLLADPPWKTKSGRMTGKCGFADSYKGKNRKLPYPTMSFKEICALGSKVDALAEPDAHLYVWFINKYVHRVRELLRAWKFDYSTMLVWTKAPMGAGLGEPFGITTEFLVHAKRGTCKARNRVVGTHFNWKRPYRNGAPYHSGKPEESYGLIEHVSHGPFLEMFSRADQPRLGWSYWGNESLGTIELPEGVGA